MAWQQQLQVSGFIAVGLGAALGAWLRWLLALALNHVNWLMPLGTLIANLTGAYLIGVLVAFFQNHSAIDPAWRLFLITGFLGGLTTFSTFSAEAMAFLQKADYLAAVLHSAAHLMASIALCCLGFASYRYFHQ